MMHAGWNKILYKAFKRINVVISSGNVQYFKVSDLKEKYGHLVLDYNLTSSNSNVRQNLDKIVDDLYLQSGKTCQVCGAKGKLIDDGFWVKTRCKNH